MSLQHLFIYFPLDVGLWDVRAVDFNVDFSVFLLLLLLSVERASVADEVERQQEAQHAESKESNVDLEDDTRISHVLRFYLWVCVFKYMGVCVHPYPEWVSLQGPHHGQKQGLLQQSEHSTDQRLHAC